jgi:hypothetical protein
MRSLIQTVRSAYILFENTKRSSAGHNPQSRLALAKGRLGTFALGNIEIDAKNAVRPDGCMTAEPALGSIRQAYAEFIVVCLTIPLQTFQLSVTCLEILGWRVRAERLNGDDARCLWQTEEMSLLRVDDCFAG